jgi:hypothetical protein
VYQSDRRSGLSLSFFFFFFFFCACVCVKKTESSNFENFVVSIIASGMTKKCVS